MAMKARPQGWTTGRTVGWCLMFTVLAGWAIQLMAQSI